MKRGENSVFQTQHCNLLGLKCSPALISVSVSVAGQRHRPIRSYYTLTKLNGTICLVRGKPRLLLYNLDFHELETKSFGECGCPLRQPPTR